MHAAVDGAKASGVRIFWFILSQADTLRLMRLAYGAGIVGPGYAWASTDSVASASLFQDSETHEIQPEVLKTLAGVIGTGPRIAVDDPLYQWLDEELKLRGNNPSYSTFNAAAGAGANYWCPYAFDATLTLAKGLKNAIVNGHDPRNGTAVYEEMLALEFDGTTGTVKLDVNGDRVGAFDLVNVLENGTIAVVGIVYAGVPTIYNDTEGVSMIVWPGGTQSLPSDGVDLDDGGGEEDMLMVYFVFILGGFALILILLLFIVGGRLDKSRKEGEEKGMLMAS